MNFFNKISFDHEKYSITFFYLGVVSLIFSWIMHPFGPGVSNDSLLYLEAGNHLFSGKGFTVIRNGSLAFASDLFPVYPVLLKLITSCGIEPVLYQILMFIAFAFLTSQLMFSFGKGTNRLLTIVLSSIALLFPFVFAFYNLWTEGIYLILILLLTIAFNSGKKFPLILLFLVLLSFTRMAGVTVGISIALTWFVFKEYSKAIVAFIMSFFPLITWWYIGTIIAPENSRQLAVHWIAPFTINQFFETLGSLFSRGSSIQFILGIMIFVAPAFLYYRNSVVKNSKDRTLLFLLILFYIYPVFLFITISFIDFSTPMDYRILAPQLLVFLIFITNMFLKIESGALKKSIPLIAALCLSVFLHVEDYKSLHDNGSGYNSKEGRSFKFNQVIHSLPKKPLWYTNATHGIYFREGKIARELPLKFDIHKNKPNQDYEAGWKETLQVINDSSGVIVWIRSGAFEKSYISYEELKNTKGLFVIYDDWLCLVMSNRDDLKFKN